MNKTFHYILVSCALFLLIDMDFYQYIPKNLSREILVSFAFGYILVKLREGIELFGSFLKMTGYHPIKFFRNS